MRSKRPSDKTAATQHRCDSCARAVPSFDIVGTGGVERPEDLCTRCFNATISERLGLQFTHPVFAPVQLQGPRRRRFTFHFRTLFVPSGLLIDAFELEDGVPGGYQFSILGDFDVDPIKKHRRLLARIRRSLRLCHLEVDEYGVRHLEPVVRGRISSEPSVHEPAVVIDGVTFSWEEFGRMLLTYEGFQFKLDMVDRVEEV